MLFSSIGLGLDIQSDWLMVMYTHCLLLCVGQCRFISSFRIWRAVKNFRTNERWFYNLFGAGVMRWTENFFLISTLTAADSLRVSFYRLSTASAQRLFLKNTRILRRHHAKETSAKTTTANLFRWHFSVFMIHWHSDWQSLWQLAVLPWGKSYDELRESQGSL